MNRNIFLLITMGLCGLLLSTQCSEQTLKTVKIKINGHIFIVEVARTQEERVKGLMNRKHLGKYAGMIFVYNQDQMLTFWMDNTYIPLTVAFIEADGTIVQLEDMRPLDHKKIRSQFYVRYALEVNQGIFTEAGINVGDKIELPPDF